MADKNVNKDKQERIFGPYDIFPIAYICHDEPSTLVRVVYEMRAEEEEMQEKPAEEMNWKKLVLYYLFLYTPESQRNHQSESEEPGVLEEQVLCNATGFEIFKEKKKYFIRSFSNPNPIHKP